MPVDEQALVLGAQRSAEGFAALYRHFERPVLAFFLRCTGRPELAADLTAETFAAALESVARYDADRGRCDQWLFGIARNVLGKSQRRGAWTVPRASAWRCQRWCSTTISSSGSRV